MPAAAGYEKAAAGLRVDDLQVEWLDGLLPQDAARLLRDEKLEMMISDNALSMEMFRRAAALSNDGRLLAQATEAPASAVPGPGYGPHLKLFRLLLLDARRKAASGQRRGAEVNLLAAAGFIAQLAEQKEARLLSAVTLEFCLGRAYPYFALSLRGNNPSPSYMADLAALLARARAGLAAAPLAMKEEAELGKAALRETVNPEKAALERGVMPFYKRYAYRRLENDDYFKRVYARFDAAADARAVALTEAFGANDPAAGEAFVKGQLAELAAKDTLKGRLGFVNGYKATVAEAHGVRSAMADSAVNAFASAGSPEYWKLISGYHAAASMLDVLRSALAVKEYQRRRRALPDGLARLVPAFLPEVPVDPFNKFAPLSYSPRGRSFTIHAFGPDGDDDGAAKVFDRSAFRAGEAPPDGDIIYTD
ncbi:MAG: hypothetical protein FD189_1787 [Elusimicrobia bacterium]|nr:MAG: hypothetical protein FD154_1930 [Elusimicrobiota bacterium]KAF0154603.1 MAG: hypothetical protein FD189_1787 [Elusimicrobiota bacterium]